LVKTRLKYNNISQYSENEVRLFDFEVGPNLKTGVSLCVTISALQKYASRVVVYYLRTEIAAPTLGAGSSHA